VFLIFISGNFFITKYISCHHQTHLINVYQNKNGITIHANIASHLIFIFISCQAPFAICSFVSFLEASKILL
jgi:hypothetical protein